MTIAIVVIVVLILIYALITYNLIVKRLNSVMHSKSSIDVYLTQRFELIPNLADCVKKYSIYEEKMFTNQRQKLQTDIKGLVHNVKNKD